MQVLSIFGNHASRGMYCAFNPVVNADKSIALLLIQAIAARTLYSADCSCKLVYVLLPA